MNTSGKNDRSLRSFRGSMHPLNAVVEVRVISVMKSGKDVGRRRGDLTNAQMLNAQCSMLNAQCSMLNSQFPILNSHPRSRRVTNREPSSRMRIEHLELNISLE